MALLNASLCLRRDDRLKKLLFTWTVVFALVLAGAKDLPALPTASNEYQLKAGFLYNFAHFIEWPAKAFADPASPIIIGVLGNDPLASYLDEIVRGEKVNNRSLAIQRYQQIEEIKTCHILFVSESAIAQLQRILISLKGRSILTVGDTDGFARRGGVIRFVTKNNKIRFRINLEAAKAANLTISSKLLRAAEIVAPEGN